jgi:hypothetical protein
MALRQRGRALILDICSIRGGITKLGRSANVLVGFAGAGVIFATNLMKGSKIGSHRQPLQCQRSVKGTRAWRKEIFLKKDCSQSKVKVKERQRGRALIIDMKRAAPKTLTHCASLSGAES